MAISAETLALAKYLRQEAQGEAWCAHHPWESTAPMLLEPYLTQAVRYVLVVDEARIAADYARRNPSVVPQKEGEAAA